MDPSADAFEGELDESSSWDDSHPMRAVRPAPAVVSGDVVHDIAKDGVLAALGLTQAPTLRRLGRYIVLGVLGRGGMGTVLKAYDEELDRQVALKLLHSDLSERHARRLRREAQALAKLDHPNVVKVFEVGEAEGQTFIAMQLVKGTTLEAWQRQEPRRGWKECVEAYLQAGRGLAAAHEAGLVHRDFKPANCIIDEKRRVQVLDFGLARGVGRAAGGEAPGDDALRPEPKDDALGSALTSTGRAMGTVAYMSLEHLNGTSADAYSDQFSFCSSLYEAVHGERPFEGSTAAELATTMGEGLVRASPKGAKVPPRLRQILLRGLATRPEARWPSMDVLLAELQRLVAPKTRRWLALGVASGLAAIGVGLGMEGYTEVMNRCTGARAQLVGIWDETRKQEVKHAILATKLTYAPGTWERVERWLDDYAEAWSSKHTEVCEATSMRQEQSAEVMDLRMECLRDRRVALREAVEVLAKANETRVEKAVSLVAGLPELSRCDDVEALRADLPPPEDPAVAEQVEAQRERLQWARSLEKAGEYDETLAVAEAVVRHAEALEYAPLLAEAALLRGRARERMGQYDEAESDLEHAYALAVENGHDVVEANAVADLTWVVGARRDHHEHGLWWGRTARLLARGPEAEAFALSNVGVVLHKQGQFTEALNYHLQALAIREEALGPMHPEVAVSVSNVGLVLDDQGQYEEALRYYRRALAIREEALGPMHPTFVGSLVNVGGTLMELGRVEDGLAYLQRSLAIEEETLGPTHPGLATTLGNLAVGLHAQGKLDEALTYQQRALAISEEALGPTHPDVALTLKHIGILLSNQGKLDEALTYQQRALAILEAALGPSHPEVASSLNAIGSVLMQQNELDEALVHYQRVLVIVEEALGPTHASVAHTLGNIGNLLQAQDEPEQARPYYQRALDILEKALGPTHPHLAYPLCGLAEVALHQHDFEVARAHAERAVSVRESGEASPIELAVARFMLAHVLWSDRTQRPRACALTQQARDALAEQDTDGDPKHLAEVQQWLAEHCEH